MKYYQFIKRDRYVKTLIVRGSYTRNPKIKLQLDPLPFSTHPPLPKSYTLPPSVFILPMGPTATALDLKLLAIALILFSGAAGVSIPLLGRRHLHVHRLPFALAKAFAAGVILATGFVHMLPGAMDSLSSLSDFPFPGFAAMLAALATLVVDFVGTRVYEGRDGNEKGKGVEVGTERGENSRRMTEDGESSSSNGRHIVASQV